MLWVNATWIRLFFVFCQKIYCMFWKIINVKIFCKAYWRKILPIPIFWLIPSALHYLDCKCVKKVCVRFQKIKFDFSGNWSQEQMFFKFVLHEFFLVCIYLFHFIFQLTQWYRDEWWNAANIIATDFFLGNNLIEESIIANRRRNACRRQARFSW